MSEFAGRVGAIFDDCYKQLQKKISEQNITISVKTITFIIRIAMEIAEATRLKGEEQKTLVEKIVRKVVTHSDIEEDKKQIVIAMLDEGMVGDVIDLVVVATKGELNINSVKQVASGCCAALFKRR
tara:strand:- start:685 stop:1062 length:378 start_codon:yes stop_codon:yes gene_type:complete